MDPISEGKRLGRYECRSKLGAGGMGDVYLAEDTQLRRRVALKVLPPETAADAQARHRLLREARAAATLDHPGICSVYEVGEDNGLLFIAMQYVEGETLEARLHRSPLGLPETLSIAVQVADALTEAHGHGILHRDIKPANIMVTPRGEAKVMDFGLAKPTRAEGAAPGDTETGSLLSTPGTIMGTLPYMSPEQVRGEELDRRSDLFSLGVVLYEMVSGRRPFDDTNPAAIASAILTRAPLPLARFAPDTPAELERIVTKAVRKSVNDRYQSARDLLNDLRTLRDDQAFQARLGSTPPIEHHAEGAAPATRAGVRDAVNAPPAPPVRSSAGSAGTATRYPQRSSRIAAVVLSAAVAAAVVGWFLWRSTNVRWANAQVPSVVALANDRRYFEAYDLALAIERYVPGEPTIAGLMPTISDAVSATTDPAGARVYLKRFSGDGSPGPPRQLLGTTPFASLRIARGDYVLSIEKDGYAATERTLSGTAVRAENLTITPPPARIETRLIPAGTTPAGMVFVPGGDYRLVGWERPTDRRVRLSDYYIGQFEVTNQEFKDFINAGGYVKREFWKHPFVKDGQRVSWETGLTLLVDRTGLPGPRGWSNQNAPEGKADHPVTDVSWYEAAAYAAFRGRRLPTIYQWEKAARDGRRGGAGVMFMPWGLFYPGDTLLDRANFAGSGTLPVSSSAFGMSPYGAYNMAGNVAEWTLNDSSDGFLATGGAWGEPIYTFAKYGGRPGFFSSDKLGFRVAQYAAEDGNDQGGLRIEPQQEIPVYSPLPASAFEARAAKYRYEKTPLDARIEETRNTAEWTREKISFNGADGERALAYLYLPHHVARPLQVLNYVPGGDVDSGHRALPESMDERMGVFVKAGRAVLGVVLKGYIERLSPASTVEPNPSTVEYLERIVNRVTDVRRGIDYLATRPDIDTARLGFVGPSSGARIGMVLAAVEPRYRAVVMIGAGLRRSDALIVPEANPAAFVSHIRVPKLIVAGRYDEDTPLRTTTEPLFKLLVEPKRLVVFEGGHIPATSVLMQATAGWLDETLGPVKR